MITVVFLRKQNVNIAIVMHDSSLWFRVIFATREIFDKTIIPFLFVVDFVQHTQLYVGTVL